MDFFNVNKREFINNKEGGKPMRLKYLQKLYIPICALALTGMVGVPVVKAACSAQGSIGIQVGVPENPATIYVGDTVNYFVRICNQSFDQTGGVTTDIAGLLTGDIVVTPACESSTSCTNPYPINTILDYVGCSLAPTGVVCSENPDGTITMATTGAPIQIGPLGCTSMGYITFTALAPVPFSIDPAGQYFLRADTGSNDLQVNDAVCSTPPATGGAQGSTSAFFPAFCGDFIVGNSTNANGVDETCDPFGSPGPNPVAPYNECRSDAVDDACTYCGDGLVTATGVVPGGINSAGVNIPEAAGETCDEGTGNSMAPNATCRPWCAPLFCGDGVTDTATEACDYNDSSWSDSSYPEAVCRGAGPEECTYCGDGVKQASEACEPAAPQSDPNCSDSCQIIAYCGDSIVGNTTNNDGFVESCDPPGSTPATPSGNENLCRGPDTNDQCTYCGDGVVNTASGEECDDGNDVETDGCNTSCLEVPCTVDIQKEVNCGEGWVEDCTNFDGETVQVRYVVTNTGGTDLVECNIGETNPAIGSGINTDFALGAGQSTTIAAGPDITCSDAADDAEPDTADIECTCAADEPGTGGVVDSDGADFNCVNCEVEIIKTVGPAGGPYGESYTTVDHQLVAYQIQVNSSGRDVLSGCVLNDDMLGIVDQPVVPGEPVSTFGPEKCEDGTAGPDIEGTNTASVACSVCAGETVEPTSESPYYDEDSAVLDCLTPDISAAKACEQQSDGSFTYTFTLTNTGETAFDCDINDSLVPGSCGDPAGSAEEFATGIMVAADSTATPAYPGQTVTTSSCNEATVACYVQNPNAPGDEMDECYEGTCVWSGETCTTSDDCGPKMVVMDVNADCLVQEGCLTRTPGYWGTHSWATMGVISDAGGSITSCGIDLDNVGWVTQGSAIEDMCFGGGDTKGAGYSPQQTQLIRQCTAATLNITASSNYDGSCSSYTVEGGPFDGKNIDVLMAECCDDLCTSGASGSAISSSGCIEAIDMFNNSQDMPFDVNPDLCGDYAPLNDKGKQTCAANNEACKESSNNGWMNCRTTLGTNSCL